MDQNLSFALQLAAATSPLWLGVASWLVRSGIQDLKSTLKAVNAKLESVEKTLAAHENRFTEGNGEFRSLREKYESLEKRLHEVEDRERSRGCNVCRFNERE